MRIDTDLSFGLDAFLCLIEERIVYYPFHVNLVKASFVHGVDRTNPMNNYIGAVLVSKESKFEKNVRFSKKIHGMCIAREFFVCLDFIGFDGVSSTVLLVVFGALQIY